MDNQDQKKKDTNSGISNVPQTVELDDIQTRFSPLRFLIITIGGVFLAEVIAMITLIRFSNLPYYLQTLIDASIMTILIFPIVYSFSLRPLLHYIDRHQRMENALRRSEERFVLAYRSNPAALSITRAEDGCFTEVNESFLRLYGYARNQVIGHTSDELNLYPNPAEREKLKWMLIKQGSVDNFEMTTRIKFGEIRIVSVSTDAIELGGEVNILAVASDITEQKQAEARLRRVNHALSVLNECNQVLVRAENETELLQQMCEIIVNIGEYRMAWVGFAEQDQARSVHPVAQFGFDDGYLGLAQITWADNERGRGPTGTAIREGVAQVNQNFLTNLKTEPWRAAALLRGYQSSIALPLIDGGSCFGALTIYSVAPDAFDGEEVKLLSELANDLAFGITALRVRAERNRAQEQVREMALFPALNPDAVLRVDKSGQIEKTNPAANQMGFCEGAQLAENLPELRDMDFNGCIATGTTQQVSETQLGGLYFQWTIRGVPELGLAFLYSSDITERKRAEVAVRQLSRIVEQTDDAVVVTDRKGVIEYVNPAFERLTGFTKEEALGKTPNLLKSGFHDEQFYKRLWNTILNGDVFLSEIANRKKNGELFHEVKTITPLRDVQGKITHFVATGKNITKHKLDEEKLRKAYDELELRVHERTEELRIANSELEEEITVRKQAEEALRKAHDELELRVKERTWELSNEINERKEIERQLRIQTAAMRAAANGILITDCHGIIEWTNPALTRMTGYEAHELLGQNTRIFKSGTHDADFYHQMWTALLSGQTWRGEMINRRKEGSLYVEEQTLTAVRDENEQIQHFIAIKQDITERKQAEAELAERNVELQALSMAEHKQRQLSEALVEAALVLNKSMKLDEVLPLILEQIGEVIPYQLANITMLDGESFYDASHEGDQRWSNALAEMKNRFPLENFPLLTRMRDSGQPLLILDTQKEPDWFTVNGLEWSRSFLSAPLRAENQVIGFLNLFAEEPGFFTMEMQNRLVAFASHAAVAIQNAWLFEQVRASSDRLQSLSHRLVEIQENERLYIARELHDEAGQMLTSLMLDLHVLETQVYQPELILNKITEMEVTLNAVSENLHSVAMALRPASLDHLGLVPALRQHVELFGEKYGLRASFRSGKFKERLPASMETEIYRIVQEALTNVARHAHATRVDVILTVRDNKLIVIVEDDGEGFNPEKAPDSGHLGLFGMRERAEMIGGKLVIESAPGKGTTLIVEVNYADSNIDRG